MQLIIKPKFKRDVDKISSYELLIALQKKIRQITIAKTRGQITGLKQLRGYSHHFRIIVKTEKYSYRIGAMIRSEKIWLIRFLPRKTVYEKFP